ncbi:MAG: hypothetical protein K2H60_03925 [Muribaculaceae bacterium]|nr:hypothetical protein [Muribaculaceae bacterium]
MNYLRCYLMTYDTQFAPNPFYGILTLATCKPVIRRKAEIGDWISGWTAMEVRDKENKKHTFKDGQKMIYLARITDKMTFAEYWEKYPEKRPVSLSSITTEKRCGRGCGGKKQENTSYNSGDNIYKPYHKNDKTGEISYEQLENSSHKPDEADHDLSGKYVLLCDEFYYFGVNNALDVPKEIFNYAVPRSKKIELAHLTGFVDYIRTNFEPGIIA